MTIAAMKGVLKGCSTMLRSMSVLSLKTSFDFSHICRDRSRYCFRISLSSKLSTTRFAMVLISSSVLFSGYNGISSEEFRGWLIGEKMNVQILQHLAAASAILDAKVPRIFCAEVGCRVHRHLHAKVSLRWSRRYRSRASIAPLPIVIVIPSRSPISPLVLCHSQRGNGGQFKAKLL